MLVKQSGRRDSKCSVHWESGALAALWDWWILGQLGSRRRRIGRCMAWGCLQLLKKPICKQPMLTLSPVLRVSGNNLVSVKSAVRDDFLPTLFGHIHSIDITGDPRILLAIVSNRADLVSAVLNQWLTDSAGPLALLHHIWWSDWLSKRSLIFYVNDWFIWLAQDTSSTTKGTTRHNTKRWHHGATNKNHDTRQHY